MLLNFDLALVEAVLRMPSRQPDYRQNRPHREFIRNLPTDRQTVKRALREAWQADEAFGSPPLAAVDALIQENMAGRNGIIGVSVRSAMSGRKNSGTSGQRHELALPADKAAGRCVAYLPGECHRFGKIHADFLRGMGVRPERDRHSRAWASRRIARLG